MAARLHPYIDRAMDPSPFFNQHDLRRRSIPIQEDAQVWQGRDVDCEGLSEFGCGQAEGAGGMQEACDRSVCVLLCLLGFVMMLLGRGTVGEIEGQPVGTRYMDRMVALEAGVHGGTQEGDLFIQRERAVCRVVSARLCCILVADRVAGRMGTKNSTRTRVIECTRLLFSSSSLV